MRNFNLCSFSVFLFVFYTLAHAESLRTCYFTPRNIYRFAEYLYDEGDYLRAAGEFQRYLFAFDSFPPLVDSIFYKIGLCYRLGGNTANAMEYFYKLIDNYPQSPYANYSYHQIALSFHLLGEYEKSNEFIELHLSDISQEHQRFKLKQLKGLNCIRQKKWSRASDFLNDLNNTEHDSLTSSLLKFAQEGQQLTRKNKPLAGLFSAIIPGTGKIYCNRPRDGFFSLFTIGLTGWQAYDGFSKDGKHSIRGWTFGTISALFYMGNIYGSVVAAQIYNEEQEEKLLNKLKISINVNFH